MNRPQTSKDDQMYTFPPKIVPPLSFSSLKFAEESKNPLPDLSHNFVHPLVSSIHHIKTMGCTEKQSFISSLLNYEWLPPVSAPIPAVIPIGAYGGGGGSEFDDGFVWRELGQPVLTAIKVRTDLQWPRVHTALGGCYTVRLLYFAYRRGQLNKSVLFLPERRLTV